VTQTGLYLGTHIDISTSDEIPELCDNQTWHQIELNRDLAFFESIQLIQKIYQIELLWFESRIVSISYSILNLISDQNIQTAKI
jgi:hypothetical protein